VEETDVMLEENLHNIKTGIGSPASVVERSAAIVVGDLNAAAAVNKHLEKLGVAPATNVVNETFAKGVAGVG
jgi:hypothetical protein